MTKPHWGLIGLATMGENLARNFADKSIPIAVFNRTASKMQAFIAEHGSELLTGHSTLSEFVQAIDSPRRIILLVKAGEAVDTVIASLIPHLQPGDTIIDGGNSYFADTQKREQQLRLKNINFVGMGISGGAEGALLGPSMMPGGESGVVAELLPDLALVAAKDFNGRPAVGYIGSNGAGHFVKMVHNGIEYAVMQIIAEIYDYLRSCGFSTIEAAEYFEQLNKGDAESYLLSITAKILQTIDEETGQPLVELVLDKSENKGTGKWTLQTGLELGISLPTLAAGLFARYSSSSKAKRVERAGSVQINFGSSAKPVVASELLPLFTLAVVSAYAQGCDLLKAADSHYQFGLKIPQLWQLWQGGCIIRSQLLSRFVDVDDPFTLAFVQSLITQLPKLEQLLSQFPTPKLALASSLEYIKQSFQANSAANLIQAQRDYFGQHTYERTDKEGSFTGGWL